MGSGGLDDYRIQIPTVSTDAFNGSHSCTLNACTSILSLIMLTNKDLNRAEHGQHDSSLVHIIDILS